MLTIGYSRSLERSITLSFNPQDVFSSVQSFLSSGYVLLAVIVVLGISAIKKLIGLAIVGGIIFCIWFFCQDAIYEAWQGVLGFVTSFMG